jgi:hypothetical protein
LHFPLLVIFITSIFHYLNFHYLHFSLLVTSITCIFPVT